MRLHKNANKQADNGNNDEFWENIPVVPASDLSDISDDFAYLCSV